ncbi:MAG: hypothetical protein JWN23_424 [Rhodocyclales bacterium]|nr:hypothetical protein [Rhodocyclales bacterium]
MLLRKKPVFLMKFTVVLMFATLLSACDKAPDPAPPPKVQPTTVLVAAPVKYSIQINSSPLFESQGGWGAGYLQAVGHGSGVVVGPGTENPNVFAQGFVAKPLETFKLVARASSVDKPQAMGRFQINWVGEDNNFISVSSETFEVTPEEKTFEYIATAPANAAKGILYVVADGQDNVVRYTEMRLLGAEGRTGPN